MRTTCGTDGRPLRAMALRKGLALSCVWIAALGCAASQWQTRVELPPHVDAPGEDAVARYYAPDEVDAVARLVTPIDPPYPPAMRTRGREGHVVARILVRADGSVAGAELLETTDAAFSEAARTQIRDARFAPALLSGAAVPSWVIVRIRFRLA